MTRPWSEIDFKEPRIERNELDKSLSEYVRRLYTDKPKYLRHGQWAFNLLDEMRPDLARRIRGNTELDPYYDDEIIGRFTDWLFSVWGGPLGADGYVLLA